MEHDISRESVVLFQENFDRLKAEIGRRIVGYADVVDQVLTAMFAGGHVLLEGVPGLGKTLLVRTISEATHLSFRRIQFTPDLMPADITGTNIIHDDEHGGRQFRFQPGPIFAHLVLADEINRATPKTQSAILEAMQEQRVTVGGTTHVLPDPFWVLATQNPIEMEGTYPLPEAQVDRFFFKVNVMPQGEEELLGIIDRTTGDDLVEIQPALSRDDISQMQHTVRQVLVADFVKRYAARVALATHPDNDKATPMVRQFVRYGVSPRGVQTLILAGKVRALMADRYNVSCEDIREIVRPALRHRIIRNFEAEAENVSTDAILLDILELVSEPAAVAAR
ncbi:MAG: AAA family ATPase [Planctomycetia bacterium]|jgi:MoxR-like ATPase|nr:AAA family ATPase [Planctomycetia bacterium]MCC7315876.1 AAA family ATPase [Planctomycetota bacterium]